MKKNKSVQHYNAKASINNGMKLFFFVFLFSISGCAVSLAPKYDQNLVDNLTSTSARVFKLLAEVSNGTSNTTFGTREPEYNDVIGSLEALKLQINARPLPHNKAVDKIISKANESLTKRGISTLISLNDTAPSANAIQQVINNINQMKKDDAGATGVTVMAAKAYKGFIELYYDQALTYERFLSEK